MSGRGALAGDHRHAQVTVQRQNSCQARKGDSYRFYLNISDWKYGNLSIESESPNLQMRYLSGDGTFCVSRQAHTPSMIPQVPAFHEMPRHDPRAVER